MPFYRTDEGFKLGVHHCTPNPFHYIYHHQ